MALLGHNALDGVGWGEVWGCGGGVGVGGVRSGLLSIRDALWQVH